MPGISKPLWNLCPARTSTRYGSVFHLVLLPWFLQERPCCLSVSFSHSNLKKNPKGNQSWIFIGRTDVEVETPILWLPDAKSWLIWKDPDAGKDWQQGEKGEDRGWDGWMASLTQWTWVWINSGSWWWTGRPGMLQSMGSQRVGHNWATELNWTLKRSSMTSQHRLFVLCFPLSEPQFLP